MELIALIMQVRCLSIRTDFLVFYKANRGNLASNWSKKSCHWSFLASTYYEFGMLIGHAGGSGSNSGKGRL